jgi:hypothetical protein
VKEYSVSSIGKGAQILGRYNHPDDWIEGETVGDDRLTNTMALRIDEISSRRTPVLESGSIALGLRAWATSNGFTQDEVRINKSDGYGYLVVPTDHWKRVLKALKEP